VQVDATALTGTYLGLDYVSLDLKKAHGLSVLPGPHTLWTSGGSNVSFTVGNDGTIDYAPALEGVLSGRGTSSLSVRGRAVQVDATALTGTYLGFDYVSLDLKKAHSISVLPGPHTLWTSGGSNVSFTVGNDGTIDYAPALEGVLSGRGTSSLVVRGRAVQVDATALTGTYLGLDYVSFDLRTPLSVNLLPGPHAVWTSGSPTYSFTVAADGTIDYAPTLDGVLSGRGTRTLVLRPRQ
jgi:hypothetical protein